MARGCTTEGVVRHWAEFAKPVPSVGFQSLVGMQRMGHLHSVSQLPVDRHLLLTVGDGPRRGPMLFQVSETSV